MNMQSISQDSSVATDLKVSLQNQNVSHSVVEREMQTVTIDADSVVMRLYQRIPIPATIFNQQDSIPAIHPFLPLGSLWPSAAGP